MNLNATLLVQMLCFIVFVAVTVRYIWPPLVKAMEDRRQKIADGLAAAEQGKKDHELAEVHAKEMLLEARQQAAKIVEQANQRAHHIIEEAKNKARDEGVRLVSVAKEEIQQMYQAVRTTLLQEISGLAVQGAERILRREIDQASNDRLIQEMVKEISECQS